MCYIILCPFKQEFISELSILCHCSNGLFLANTVVLKLLSLYNVFTLGWSVMQAVKEFTKRSAESKVFLFLLSQDGESVQWGEMHQHQP